MPDIPSINPQMKPQKPCNHTNSKKLAYLPAHYLHNTPANYLSENRSSEIKRQHQIQKQEKHSHRQRLIKKRLKAISQIDNLSYAYLNIKSVQHGRQGPQKSNQSNTGQNRRPFYMSKKHSLFSTLPVKSKGALTPFRVNFKNASGSKTTLSSFKQYMFKQELPAIHTEYLNLSKLLQKQEFPQKSTEVSPMRKTTINLNLSRDTQDIRAQNRGVFLSTIEKKKNKNSTMIAFRKPKSKREVPKQQYSQEAVIMIKEFLKKK